MNDMFYFSSRVPLPAKCCQYPIEKRKSCKRRRVSKMDIPTQHAYVTHFEEPTFCANSVASIVPQDAYSYIILLPGLSTASSLASSDARSPVASIAALCSHHPRPYSRDTWEEEDGRRLRFALPSDDEEEEHVRSQVSDNAIDGKQDTVLNSTLSSNTMPSVGSAASREQAHVNAELSPASAAAAIPEHVLSLPDLDVQFSAHFSSAQLSHSRSGIDSPAMDDDAVAVDDPRRHYDVADFMETWRLWRRRADEAIPTDEPERQGHMWPQIQPNDVQRVDVAENGLDMQGLSWDLPGCDRDDALLARRRLHPFKTRKAYQSDCALSESTHYYRFRAFSPRHRAQYSHHQLRNVLAAGNRNEIFYSTGDRVVKTSLSIPSMERSVLDVSKSATRSTPFRITCLDASRDSAFTSYRSDSVVIAGGFYGEYAMLGCTSSARSQHTGIVTNDWNGVITSVNLTTPRRSGLLQAEFCSNDRKLRTLDCHSQQFKDLFTYDSSINCSATAPDHRLRLLVGDFHHALVTDAEKGDVLFRLKAHHDFGFACAWSPDSHHVATGAQDGRVHIWDSRMWGTPVQSLFSEMSCPRSLSFTDDGLLIVAEDDDVVSIVDPQDSDSRQDIRFFGSIAGISLLDGGDEIVVANADRTVGGLFSFQRSRSQRRDLESSSDLFV